jgi:replicative DNA helicase
MESPRLNISKDNEKKLPSNLEAEQSLIGSVLVNNDIIDETSGIVNSHKLYRY